MKKSYSNCNGASLSSYKEGAQLHIAYMMNPDTVIYDSLDKILIKKLEEQGALVTAVQLEDISFHLSNESGKSNTIYLKDKPLEINGFFSYGAMSQFHYKAYTYIIRTLFALNIPTLHSPEADILLNDKYLQMMRFKNAGLKIPQTNIGFSVESFKTIINTYYPKDFVLKKLNDYGGDGVIISENSQNAVNLGAKLLWKNEYCIYQQLIKDSPGKSVRVLCINGKPSSCVEYIAKTNDKRSNHLFGQENLSCYSLMESYLLKDYFETAQKAIDSIELNLTVGGVDILNSKEHGLVLLEVNMWPDLDEMCECTSIDTYKLLAEAFYQKVLKSVNCKS